MVKKLESRNSRIDESVSVAAVVSLVTVLIPIVQDIVSKMDKKDVDNLKSMAKETIPFASPIIGAGILAGKGIKKARDKKKAGA